MHSVSQVSFLPLAWRSRRAVQNGDRAFEGAPSCRSCRAPLRHAATQEPSSRRCGKSFVSASCQASTWHLVTAPTCSKRLLLRWKLCRTGILGKASQRTVVPASEGATVLLPLLEGDASAQQPTQTHNQNCLAIWLTGAKMTTYSMRICQ